MVRTARELAEPYSRSMPFSPNDRTASLTELQRSTAHRFGTGGHRIFPAING
jgi:hypothetical protein